MSLFLQSAIEISTEYGDDRAAILYPGDCRALLSSIPDEAAHLVVTSPPYNIGKAYETKKSLEEYLDEQRPIIRECVRILHPRGSICWQVGNHVSDGEVVPLDIVFYPLFAELGLKLRNRIVWHFEHGLHCSQRFSGRHETILWFTKTDDCVFNLDPIRIPVKYPGKKYYKGPRAGQYSSNPLGKNPGDVWAIPNVKHNHPEKTVHPCQFPVELVERCVLSMTHEGNLVVDPFMGVGSALAAAVMHGRRAAGAEIVAQYYEIAVDRVRLAAQGLLRTRPMGKPIYEPSSNSSQTRRERLDSSHSTNGESKDDAPREDVNSLKLC